MAGQTAYNSFMSITPSPVASVIQYYSTTTSTSTIMSFVTSTVSISTQPATETTYTTATSPPGKSKSLTIFGMVFGACLALFVVAAIIASYFNHKAPGNDEQDVYSEQGDQLEIGLLSSPTSRARLRYLLQQRRNGSAPAHAYDDNEGAEQAGLAGSRDTLPQ